MSTEVKADKGNKPVNVEQKNLTESKLPKSSRQDAQSYPMFVKGGLRQVGKIVSELFKNNPHDELTFRTSPDMVVATRNPKDGSITITNSLFNNPGSNEAPFAQGIAKFDKNGNPIDFSVTTNIRDSKTGKLIGKITNINNSEMQPSPDDARPDTSILSYINPDVVNPRTMRSPLKETTDQIARALHNNKNKEIHFKAGDGTEWKATWYKGSILVSDRYAHGPREKLNTEGEYIRLNKQGVLLEAGEIAPGGKHAPYRPLVDDQTAIEKGNSFLQEYRAHVREQNKLRPWNNEPGDKC